MDTGSSTTFLNSTHIERNDQNQERELLKTPSGDTVTLKKINTDEIELKNATIALPDSYKSAIHDMDIIENNTDTKLQGILSADLLSRFVLTYDKTKSKGKLFKNLKQSNIDTSSFKKHDLNKNLKVKQLLIESKKIKNLKLDTGAASSGFKNESLSRIANKCPIKERPIVNLKKETTIKSRECDQINIGGYLHHDIQLDRQAENALGTDFLCSHDFIIDFPNRHFYWR